MCVCGFVVVVDDLICLFAFRLAVVIHICYSILLCDINMHFNCYHLFYSLKELVAVGLRTAWGLSDKVSVHSLLIYKPYVLF